MEWDDINRALNAYAHVFPGQSNQKTFAVKANFAVAGYPQTSGSAVYNTRVAEEDAGPVMQLRGAGWHCNGITHMDPFGIGARGANPDFGQVGNPCNRALTPGGSSAGSAAAVAAGLCDIAIGSDTLGSVRIPASYCGLYGYKAAPLAIDRAGLDLLEPDFDSVGLLARSLDTVMDGAAALHRVPPIAAAQKVYAFNIDAHEGIDPQVRRAYGQLLDDLQIETLSVAISLSRVRKAAFLKTAKTLAHTLSNTALSAIAPDLYKTLTAATARAAEKGERDAQLLADAAAQLNSLIAPGCILISPTTPQPAFPISAASPPCQADFTALANVAALPAISLPLGYGADGAPFGVQLMSGPQDLAALFGAAKVLDGALKAYRQPGLFWQR